MPVLFEHSTGHVFFTRYVFVHILGVGTQLNTPSNHRRMAHTGAYVCTYMGAAMFSSGIFLTCGFRYHLSILACAPVTLCRYFFICMFVKGVQISYSRTCLGSTWVRPYS